MKFIYKYQSPNFNTRKKNFKLNYIIIHYTAMYSYKEAIRHLCDKNNKVSSHYLISKSGKVFNLVDTKFRAWHAGYAYWQGEKDINSSSIGIEIDNSGHHLSFENYKDIQIDSLINLLKILKKKYKIKSCNILGHSDVSPYRKIDPGEKFPWEKLSHLKILKLPINASIKFQFIIESLFENNNILLKKQKVLYLLNKIGFDISLAKKNKKQFSILIKVYQSHYRSSIVNGIVDVETYKIIVSHFKQSLTN